MPIAVACQCGQRFKAPDNLGGKTVKCPKCGQPLKIPAAAAPAAATAPLPSQPTPQPTPQPSPMMGGGLDDLLDEAGLERSTSGAYCPSCASPLKPGAILCVMCGLNLQSGERIERQYGDDDENDEFGHLESHGNEQLDKAERDMLLSEKLKNRMGDKVPWFVYLLGLIMLIGFAIGMALMPQDLVFLVLGVTMLVLGTLVSAAGSIWIIVIAFEESVLQGILCLFCPFYLWIGIFPGIFPIQNWDRCSAPYFISLAGGAVQSVGIFSIILAPMMAGGGEDLGMQSLAIPLALLAALR